jgi:hypothetical protein
MNEEQAKSVAHSLKVVTVMLTVLATMVAGFFLQSGVSGLLWLICWAVTLYGLFVMGTAITLFTLTIMGVIVAALNSASTNNEDARLQKLNEIYNRMSNK